MSRFLLSGENTVVIWPDVFTLYRTPASARP